MAYETAARVLPAAAVRGIAQRWLPKLGGGDFVCSPAGLWLALGAVAAGARGETADELRELLGVADEEAAHAVTEAVRDLAGTDALAVATGVWSRAPVHRAWREALVGIGHGPMDPDGIDQWVREATDGLVERLPVRITGDTLLLLVNALALKARWEHPFEGSRTFHRAFTDASGQASQVPTMHGTVPAGDAWTVDGRVRVVELRCEATGKSRPARVRFVLGEEGAAPADVLPAAWAPVGRRTAIDADDVVLALPRLALRTTVDATDHLAELGVRLAMSDAADFSALSPEPLAISQVVQESVLKVAEKGVEAAAVTAVPMRPGSAIRPRSVERISFDRPFGVVVSDGTGEVPLFTAWQATAPTGG